MAIDNIEVSDRPPKSRDDYTLDQFEWLRQVSERTGQLCGCHPFEYWFVGK
jgi:hypothetical protein